jgi:hypothetical protein
MASDAPDARQCVRIAAETTAEPLLRGVLVRIADAEPNDEDAVVEATRGIDELGMRDEGRRARG